MRRRARCRRIYLVFVVLQLFGKGFRMQLPREVFNGGHEARRGTIDGIADRDVATIAHSIEKTPAGKIGKSIGTVCRSADMRFHKNQKFRLKMNNFLEIDLRPVLRGLDDRDGARATQAVRGKLALSV